MIFKELPISTGKKIHPATFYNYLIFNILIFRAKFNHKTMIFNTLYANPKNIPDHINGDMGYLLDVPLFKQKTNGNQRSRNPF